LQQLLWIETLLKGSAGLLLTLAPNGTIRLLGLSPAAHTFWPRLLGILLLGIAGAIFLEGSHPGSHGLGLAGCLIVNFSAVLMLTAVLVFEAGPVSARGRVVMWALVVVLAWLCALELANL
jgi:hypothetical protein